MTDQQLAGKIAVVTGGGRGIGRSIALYLAGAGADIALCSRTSNEIDAVAAEIRALGRRALALPVDVADWAQVESFARAVTDEFDHIDILVNNAGGGFEVGPVAVSDPAGWRKTVEINLFGTYHMIRAFLDDIARGGKIINITSGMGLEARPGNSSYNAAKAGAHMLTQCLALEIWDRGIDVNDIIPGLVATTNVDWASDRSSVESVLAEFEGKQPPFAPSERVKHPDELGDLVLWVASMPEGGPTGQSFSLARRPF
jgi:NAD(P)-dependent dehydrogenase (short-subunit alcohol dehydrogenase family)